MHVSAMNWMQMERLLERENRAILPLGCTEQHAYLSLSTDSLLAERVATEAAAPLGVPVFPVIPYGITPAFRAYPGTVSLRVETLIAIVRDALDALSTMGFRRILIVNGHGGNAPVDGWVKEWMADGGRAIVRLHNWWNAPKVWTKVKEIDPDASHASWMENAAMRARLGDGSFGGLYERTDDDVLALWRVAVEETRGLLETGWE
jgi:creatinine amidohydrolase